MSRFNVGDRVRRTISNTFWTTACRACGVDTDGTFIVHELRASGTLTLHGFGPRGFDADLFELVTQAAQIPDRRTAPFNPAKEIIVTSPIQATPEELRAAADLAQQRIDAEAAKAETISKIDADITLQRAITTLLSDLHNLVKEVVSQPAVREDYATLRKQLSPVAEKYGYKIVLIGDKTHATLVQA